METIPFTLRPAFGDAVVQHSDGLYYFSEKYAQELILANPSHREAIEKLTIPTIKLDNFQKLRDLEKAIKYAETQIDFKAAQRSIRIANNKAKKEFKIRRQTSYIPRDKYYPASQYYNKMPINKDEQND